MLAELLDHVARAVPADLVPHDMRGQEFAAGHPQRRPGVFSKSIHCPDQRGYKPENVG